MKSREGIGRVVTPEDRSGSAALIAAIFMLALAMALGGLLAGCAGSTGGGATSSTGAVSTTTTPAPSTTTTVAETTTTSLTKLAWSDTGKWQGISVTAAAPQVDPSPELVGAGNKVVYCMVTLTNNGTDPFDYNGLDFILLDTDQQEYDNYGVSSMPDVGEGTLAGGESVSGAVAFEVPQSATPGAVEWQPHSADTPQLAWGQP